MKKFTLIITFVAFLFGANHIQAQVNEPANWPSTDWTITGDYVASSLLNDPTITPNFSYDDNLVSGSLFDNVKAESPVIDLTAATTALPLPHGQIAVSGSYVYVDNLGDLDLQWWDNDNHLWLTWHVFGGNSSTFDYTTCNGLVNYTSSPLIITGFTPSQLQHFKYRIRFNDNDHDFGFCFSSPTLLSQETPMCLAVTNINSDSSPILDDQAEISWTDNNAVIPQDGWEIEYGITGFSQGSGTTVTSFTNPYTVSGLNAVTCYDVYVRALCDATNSINSEWFGPFNFCTPLGVAGCGDVFYDSTDPTDPTIGGPNGNYANGIASEVTTICPDDVGDVVTVIFDAFETENCCDWMKIYDGDTTASPQIMGPGVDGTFRGTNSPGMLSATIVNGGCLTFEFHSDGSITRLGWEARVLCSPPITCFMPENLAVNEASITIHEAEVSWTDTNTTPPQSGWEIEYGPIGFTQGTGTLVTAPTNPFTLTNLDAATEYCYYVKAVCGTNSGDEDSFWQGLACFTTKCDIFTAPYMENFNNNGDTPLCWNQGTSNNEDWLFDNDVTAPGHIGQAGNVQGTTTLSGGYFAYVDDDNPNSLNTYLLSPFVDLTGIANPTLGFYHISNDEFFFFHVNFSVDIWNGTTWTEDVFTSNSNTNGWEQVFVDLTPYANQVIQVRFDVDEVNNSQFDDFAIDDVFIGEMPTCVNVNSISIDNVGANDVTLTWNDGNIPAATAWEIVYGPPGFDPNTATLNAADNNIGFVQGGLVDQTDYELYIRAVCGAGDNSLWAGPIAFTTLCPIFNAPFHEDFSDAGVIDPCWNQTPNLDPWAFANTMGGGETAHVGDNGNVFGTSTESGGYFAYVDDSAPHVSNNNTISTPLINTATLTSPTLYFHYISHNEGNTNVDFSIDVWDGAVWNTDFFTSNSNTLGWEEIILDLTNLTITGPIQVQFTVDENNGTDYYDDLAIDDIKIDEAPDCWPIYDLALSNETTTTVDLAWTDNDNDQGTTTYTVEYGPVGFALGSGQTQSVTDEDLDGTLDNPYTVVGLDVDTDWDFYITAHCPNGDRILGPVQGTTLPTCLEVTGITASNTTTTSVEISWMDNNTPVPAGGWDLEVTYPTFPQGSGIMHENITNPYTVTGLIPSSTFEIYIRANCEADGSDPSRWAGPFIINTQVGAPLNDTCADAIELTMGVDCVPILGNNILATQTTPALATACTDPAIDGVNTAFEVNDVWYKFTMSSTGIALIQTSFAGVMEDSAIAVYKVVDGTDACGTLEPAFSYLPNGNINYALKSCSDDDDFINTDASDNNLFSMVQLRNQTPGDLYYIRVWSVDRSNITSISSPPGQFTICVSGESAIPRGALEIDDNILDAVLSYYPNPVENSLNLKANTNIEAVKIFNVLGQEIRKQNFDDATSLEVNVNMHNLTSGTYFVKVLLSGDRIKTIKIIKK